MRFKKDSQPWMTGEILNGIRKRDLLFHKVKCNRLSLHLGKTECILFGSKRRLRNDLEFKVSLDGTTVKRVTSTKYLGVFIDQYLDFSDHVEKLLKKAQGKLQFLYRNSGFLD